MKPKYSYILLLAALGVLTIGFIFRPPAVPTPTQEQPEPTLNQVVVDQLQEQIATGSLKRFAGRFADAAERAAPFIFWLPQFQRSAVVFDAEHIATVVETSGPIDEVDLEGPAKRRVKPSLWNPAVPLQILERAAAPKQSPAPAPGLREGAPVWVVAVARTRSGARVFSAGVYSGEVWSACGASEWKHLQTSIPLSDSLLGGGVFDMNGALLGVVARCRAQDVVLSLDQIQALAATTRSPDTALLNKYGFTVFPDAAAAATEGPASSGVMVKEVWTHWSASRAGLLPGDRIIEIDGAAVTDAPISITEILQSAAPQLGVIRGSKKLTANLETAPSLAGVGLQSTPANRPTLDVQEDSAARKAGLATGDVVLQVDYAPASARSMAALGSITKPTFIVAQRGDRVFGVWLQP